MERLEIVKVGGAVLEDPAQEAAFLSAFAGIKGPKILVHGGGKTATSIASRLGIPTVMAEGRRITDAAMLEVVTMVYAGLVNKGVVARLQGLGVNAVGLCGADMGIIRAHKRPVSGIDYGFAGDIEKVDAGVLKDLVSRSYVPVLAPLTYDGASGLLNTNADTIASETALALSGNFDVRLTFCLDLPGVLSDPSDPESIIPRLYPDSARQLKESGTISGGMIPKIDNAFNAIHKGVGSVLLTNAENLKDGSGTLITGQP